jgi:hypothetical protein
LKYRSKKIIVSVLFVLFTGLSPISLPAQSFEVGQIFTYLSDDSLKADISLKGLLEDQVRKTLLSGLPIYMKISLTLMDQNQREIVKIHYAASIIYDVWEERFSVIDFSGNSQQYELLEEIKQWVQNLQGFSIFPQQKLSMGVSYRVMSLVEVQLTTRKQNQQIKWWLGKSDPTEEEIASEERSTGFKLNLNQLVQMLFSSSEEPNKYSASKTSDVFRLEDLEFQ